MCDYSLLHLTSRPAVVGEKLTIKKFGMGTSGFASPADCETAVCLLPGTELAFDAEVRGYYDEKQYPSVAIFRQHNKDQPFTHHDTLEFADGSSLLLTLLIEDQTATVLQLPAAPKTAAEAKEQTRLEIVG